MPTSERILQVVRRFVAAARPNEDSDRGLVERFAQSRDEQAFAELVRRHGPMVLGVCRRVLRHTADADDAFQATFLILVRRAALLRDPDRLGAWLFGVAWRVANKLRAARRCVSPLPGEIAVRPSHEPSDWSVELDAAIARLPEKYRTPVVLCHFQGLSPAEAARRLGCPAATVATRLFRARNTLRRKLTALGLAVPVALTAGSVLHVPSALAAAAHEMAAGRSIPPTAARLADGVFRSLLMTKIRWAATAAVICLTGAGVLGLRAGGQEPAAGPLAPPPTGPTAVAPPPVTPDAAEPATVTTANFRVTAPSARVARLIADAAERARKDVAVAWLGRELPARTETCRIRVTIGHSGTGGATTFDFGSDRTPSADMHVEGPLDQLLTDVVPHEVTHVVMADHFRKPLPRWADEGIALLSESEEEQARHVRLTADTANHGDLIQLKALCSARDYPRNVLAFFGESYVLTRMLVDRKDRATLLKFVHGGMGKDWESAAKEFYGATLDDLERQMLDKLKAAGPAIVDRGVKTTPIFVWATAEPSGEVAVIQRTDPVYEPVTSYVRRSVPVAGSPQPRTYIEAVTNYRLRPAEEARRTFGRGRVRAITPAGKPIDEAAMIAALKGKMVAVVLVGGAENIDKAFADLLKPDALILLVPAEKGEARLPDVSGRH
jgi:RNA polymerase sigma factor (sigma-70 family)